METYTIALATRLKRKVFRARNIPDDVIAIAREEVSRQNAALISYEVFDYGIVLYVVCRDRDAAIQIADSVRRATSGPIRHKYPELWKMPSLWNSRPLIEEGGAGPGNDKKVSEYYESLKSR